MFCVVVLILPSMIILPKLWLKCSQLAEKNIWSETGSKFNIELNMKLSRKLKCTPIIYSHLEKSYFAAHFTSVI